MTTVVNGTPSIESVMLGAPEPSVALARMTKPVDAGSDTVVDAVPAEVNASACPPEALLSETIRPEPDRVIVSDWTDVVVEVALAVALPVALLLAVTGTDMAASLSRRAENSPTAARVSAGSVGVLSAPAPDENARALAIAGAIDVGATGGEVMADADAWPGSLAGVVDWATGVAGARRPAEAGADAFFRDDEDAFDPAAVCEAAACADPDDDELEPAVSAQATGAPSPVAIAVPIPSATARAPILPTDLLAVEAGRVV